MRGYTCTSTVSDHLPTVSFRGLTAMGNCNDYPNRTTGVKHSQKAADYGVYLVLVLPYLEKLTTEMG